MSQQEAPRIAVKFCGGCNPTYNRRALFDRLRSDFPEAAIRFVNEAPQQEAEKEPPPGELPDDLALILCGCRNECLNYSRYVGKHGQILIFSEEDYGLLEAFMAAWKQNGTA